jgi:hypothetical protein
MEMENLVFSNWEVAADGTVTLGFVDQNENDIRLRLSINQLGALAMTLPQMVDRALCRRSADRAVQQVYPLTSWAVEQATDPRIAMVTLRTAGGFSVCFSMSRELRMKLGEAIASERSPDTATLVN